MNFFECWKAMKVGQDAKNETIPAYFKKTSDSIIKQLEELKVNYTGFKRECMLLSDTWEIKREKKSLKYFIKVHKDLNRALWVPYFNNILNNLPIDTDIKATFEWEK